MAAPEKQTMNLQQISDRTSFQRGATRLSDPSHIKIWYNAELADPSCFAKYAQCLQCVVFDKERSYMYLREGALETNQAYNCCIKCLACLKPYPPDCVCVSYFDKRPWKKSKGACYTCCGCCSGNPSIEKVDNTCLICFQKVTCHQACFGGDYMSYVPLDKFCCCIPNKVNFLCNICGFCGSPDGNPLCHLPYCMQPKDVEGFVAQAKQVIPAARAMHP